MKIKIGNSSPIVSKLIQENTVSGLMAGLPNKESNDYFIKIAKEQACSILGFPNDVKVPFLFLEPKRESKVVDHLNISYETIPPYVSYVFVSNEERRGIVIFFSAELGIPDEIKNELLSYNWESYSEEYSIW